MLDNIVFHDEPLEERINRKDITVDELRLRAIKLFKSNNDKMPLQVGDEYGCPVCFSKLSIENRLVIEDGYMVCDYCVNYVEGY